MRRSSGRARVAVPVRAKKPSLCEELSDKCEAQRRIIDFNMCLTCWSLVLDITVLLWARMGNNKYKKKYQQVEPHRVAPCSQALRKWIENEEMKRKRKEINPLHLSFSLYFRPLSPFPHSPSISALSLHFLHQNWSHIVAKCWIRHSCRECHTNLNIRAMRK